MFKKHEIFLEIFYIMCIKEELFASFIKGIGKTSGTITIFGFLGAAWYLYNKSTNYSLTKLFKNEEIILQELDEADELDELDELEQSKLESYIKALFAKYTIIDVEEKPKKSEQSEQSDSEQSHSEQQTIQESEAIQESVLEKDKLKMSKSNKSQNFRKIFDNL